MKSRIGIGLPVALGTVVAVVGLLMMVAPASAVPIITWADVSQSGWGDTSSVLGTSTIGGTTYSKYVDAVTAWGANLTINGVLFHSLTGNFQNSGWTGTYAGGSISESGTGDWTGVGKWGSQTSPTTDMERLLAKTVYSGPGAITLDGLTSGQKYRIEVWAPTWNNNSFTAVYGDVTESQKTLYSGLYGYSNGQAATGVFTADAVSVVIPIGGTFSAAPAISLYTIADAEPPAPVPEPGTWLLLGGSLLGLCVGGFKRIRSKLSA